MSDGYECGLCDNPAVAHVGARLRGKQKRGPFANRVTGPWWSWSKPLCWACLARERRRWRRGTRWRVRVKWWLSTTVTT